MPQGNWQDRTEWHNLVAFTRLAEIVRDYVKKGSKLYIEGKIQTRSWDDKETGVKKYRTEIIVNDLSLLSGREDGGSSSGGYSRSVRLVKQRGPAPARRPGRVQPVRRNLRRRHTVLDSDLSGFCCVLSLSFFETRRLRLFFLCPFG